MGRWRDRALRRSAALAAPWLFALALCAPANRAGASDPGLTCRLRQLSAAGRLYRAEESCWSHAYRSLRDPSRCLVHAENSFRSSYASAANGAAHSKSHCGLRLDVESLLSLAANDVQTLVVSIAGDVDVSNSRDRSLRANLMDAAGSFASRAFSAELSFVERADDARRQRTLLAAQTSLGRTFASRESSAQTRGVFYDGASSGDVVTAVQTWVDLWDRMTQASLGAFSLSGTIVAAEATFVDSDVNDTSVPPVDNGAFVQDAQLLPVPSSVGGYVNLADAGPQGNSFDFGDTVDRYKTSLRAGQVVVLALGDPPGSFPGEADLDLCLDGPVPQGGGAMPSPLCSVGFGAYEILVAPADGDYFIRVYPKQTCACGSTYTLSVGQTVPAAALRTERTDVEFVPGELIVKLRPQSSGGAARAKALALTSATGLARVAGEPEREMLVRLPPSGAARNASFRALGAAQAHDRLQAADLPDAELARQETLLALQALRQRPDVQSADLNTIVHASAEPFDPLYTLQWHYPLIHLPQAWDIETGSPSVTVAVVDTGVRLDHPDLAGKLVPGYDFISDPARSRDGDGIDPDPNDPGDRALGDASSFHGTHVAGTIGARTNNGIGVAGVAWGSKVMPVRVLGVGGGTTYDVLQGVRYAAGLDNDSHTLPAKPADVINLSLGGGGYNQAAQDLFNQLHDVAHVLVVAAAGNDDTSAPSFPASYDGVLSVAAVDLNRDPAPYSNFGTAIDLAAPGGDTSVDRNADGWADGVLSTLADDSESPISFGYVFYQGTSMAAPHVSGVLALMRSVAPTLAPDAFDALLAAGKLTEDLGTPGWDPRTGYGLIDAHAAVLAAGAPDASHSTALSVTPSGLNFGLAVDALDLVVANVSNGPLTVASVAVEDPSSAPWLGVAASSVDGSGLGSYRASVDRAQLAGVSGSVAATIDVVSSAGTVRVPVVARGAQSAAASNAGFQYVLLVDAQSFEVIDEFDVAATNGSYPYQFENVPQGQYLVITGSDMDNDGAICDGGEACGSYPTLDLPGAISLDADTSGVDFDVSFRQTINSGAAAGAAPALQPGGLHRKRR